MSEGNPVTKPTVGLSMLYRLGEEFDTMVKQLPEARAFPIELLDEGRHALDKKRVKQLRELAASYGLRYTMHAPFAEINIATPSDWLLKPITRRLKESLANAASLECEMWTFHPGLKTALNSLDPGSEWTANLKTTRTLVKLARDCGLDVGVENVPDPFPFLMKRVEDFRRFYSEVDEEVGVVLDVGHANVNGDLEAFLTEFSDKIAHVHAHDNDGVSDQHLGVGHGTVNWQKFALLLKKAAYDRIVAVESVENVEESLQRLKQLLG